MQSQLEDMILPNSENEFFWWIDLFSISSNTSLYAHQRQKQNLQACAPSVFFSFFCAVHYFLHVIRLSIRKDKDHLSAKCAVVSKFKEIYNTSANTSCSYLQIVVY